MKATSRPPTTLTIGGGATLVEVGLTSKEVLAGGLATHSGKFLVKGLAVRGVFVEHGISFRCGWRKS